MHKIDSFKGIVRGGDNMLSSGGECLDVVNMRMKGGSLVPVPQPKCVASLGFCYSLMSWHEMAAHYICVTDDGALHVYSRDWNPVMDGEGGMALFKELPQVNGVEFMGYIVCCMTENGMFYLLFNDGAYRWLGERPPMPTLEITARSKLQRIITTEKFYSTTIANLESTWLYNSKGYYDEGISMLNKDGYFIDRALFRFALRLFDGSYVCLSPVMYVSDEDCIDNVSRDFYNLHSEPYTTDSPSAYDVAVLGFKPDFIFKNLDLEGWKSVVMGIDLFTTGSIMGKKVVETGGMFYDGSSSSRVFMKYEGYKDKDLDELWNDVASAGHFYKMAEYDLSGTLVERVENVSSSSLALQQSLAGEGGSLRSLSVGCSCMFNNRLHVGSLKEWFFKGYDPFFLDMAYGEKGVLDCMYIKTSIRTFSGVSTIVRRYENVTLVCNDGVYELPPLLTYPDSRAFEMTVYVCDGDGMKCRTFGLVPHRSLDVALYLNKWYLGLRVSARASLSNGVVMAELKDKDVVGMFSSVEGEHRIVFSKSERTWMYEGKAFPAEKYASIRLVSSTNNLADGDSIVFTLTPCSNEESYSEIRNIMVDDSWTRCDGGVEEVGENPYEVRRNVLKVSAVDNPFLFPAECTYAPSQGDVLALASNTVALSQGQYGQHPMYVFCSDGMWAMSVDASGSMAYLASYPLSREVCINARSVCGVDGGVVFVGQQGVMLANGSCLVHISECMQWESSSSLSIFSNSVIARIASMMQLDSSPGVHDFMEYLQGAFVVYLPFHNEILLANEQYGSCYLYSIQKKVWSRVQLCVKGAVRSCSSVELFVADGGCTSVLCIDETFCGDNRVMLVTRPQLWGTKLPKRIIQLMLHANSVPCSNGTYGMPVLACYLLGSNDGAHFKLLAGREASSEVQDLKFPYFPTQAYKYYILAVCGEMSAGSMVTAVELETQPVWANRMR